MSPLPRSIRPLAALLALAGVLLFAACDADPGQPDAIGRPPVIRALSVSPDSIRIDQLPVEQIADSIATIPLNILVDATDPDGRIESVVFVLLDRTPGSEPVGEAALERVEGQASLYGGAFVLPLPITALGRFGILVYAIDDQGQSASARSTYVVANPILRSARATPDPFITGRDSVLIVSATVVHPRGLDEVQQVSVTLPGASTPFPLVDTGSADAGDATAGDGVYSARITVQGAFAVGDLDLTFRAFERSGAISDPVTVTITVQ